jgi:hypothetical protein
MRGGTIAMLGPSPPPVLPSFRHDRRMPPEKFVELLRELREKGLKMDEAQLPAEVNVYIGDQVADGSGELHLRHA